MNENAFSKADAIAKDESNTLRSYRNKFITQRVMENLYYIFRVIL